MARSFFSKKVLDIHKYLNIIGMGKLTYKALLELIEELSIGEQDQEVRVYIDGDLISVSDLQQEGKQIVLLTD